MRRRDGAPHLDLRESEGELDGPWRLEGATNAAAVELVGAVEDYGVSGKCGLEQAMV